MGSEMCIRDRSVSIHGYRQVTVHTAVLRGFPVRVRQSSRCRHPRRRLTPNEPHPIDSRYTLPIAMYSGDFRWLVRELHKSRAMRFAKESDSALVPSRLVRDMASLQVKSRTSNLFLVVGILLYIAMAVFAYKNPSQGDYFYAYLAALEVAAVAFVLFLKRKMNRFRTLKTLLGRLVYLAIELDTWDSDQRNVRIQRVVIGKFESCARLIEGYPRAFNLGRDESSAAVSARCLGIAAQLREYKRWVAMPIITTSADLAHRVAEAMVLVFHGTWYGLKGV